MNEAFSRVYGGYGSPLTKVFGPVLAPRTYLRAIHLLLMFPLGLAYFVGLVVALSIGGVLIWTIVGAVGSSRRSISRAGPATPRPGWSVRLLRSN